MRSRTWAAIPAEALPFVPPRNKLADWAESMGLDLSRVTITGRKPHPPEDKSRPGILVIIDDPIKRRLDEAQRARLRQIVERMQKESGTIVLERDLRLLPHQRAMLDEAKARKW